ncbi:MAG: (2Fe-2S)-binding protein [Pyrinomonadaceae bacterium]
MTGAACILLASVRRTLKGRGGDQGNEIASDITPQKLRCGKQGCLPLQSVDMIQITINNIQISVDPGTTVAVAILNAGIDHFRDSVSGDERGPLCGMGICFECRVTINGVTHQRSCTTLAENGMEVTTPVPPA